MFRTATKIAAVIAAATIGIATKFIVDDVKATKVMKAATECPCTECEAEAEETEAETSED